MTKTLHGWWRVWTWAVWGAGLSLTAATVAGGPRAIAVATGVLFALFCPWVAAMGRKLQ